MPKIQKIKAREIKDSRGNPTVEVELTTEKGSFVASCPSGASVGKNEALELRDKDGRGISKAIENVNKIIAPKLRGKNPENQKELDELMIVLDGTDNKSKLGANAILPISMAIARAGAAAQKLPLYQHLANLSENGSRMALPLPSFNILEGGVHVHPHTKRDNMDGENTKVNVSRYGVGASNDLDFQEFMVVCQKKLFAENLVLGSKIFQNLREILAKNYGGNIAMGDEGGFDPKISKTEQALYLLKNATGNLEAKIAIDCAASEFYKDGKYVLEGKEFSRQELVEFYKDLVKRFPIISIEDPFAEEDWEGFKEVKKELPNTTIIGDDLTTTNIKKIKEAEIKKACNGVIIKLNQIGTVSETIEAVNLVKSYGWKIMVSHRSGETLDTFIADFSVGVGADFIKSGSPSQRERMVKYNRLLEIEGELIKK